MQPNRAIDANYFSYTATTNDGRVHTGVLAAETSTSVTLKQQEGKTETLEYAAALDALAEGELSAHALHALGAAPGTEQGRFHLSYSATPADIA